MAGERGFGNGLHLLSRRFSLLIFLKFKSRETSSTWYETTFDGCILPWGAVFIRKVNRRHDVDSIKGDEERTVLDPLGLIGIQGFLVYVDSSGAT